MIKILLLAILFYVPCWASDFIIYDGDNQPDVMIETDTGYTTFNDDGIHHTTVIRNEPRANAEPIVDSEGKEHSNWRSYYHDYYEDMHGLGEERDNVED